MDKRILNLRPHWTAKRHAWLREIKRTGSEPAKPSQIPLTVCGGFQLIQLKPIIFAIMQGEPAPYGKTAEEQDQ